jgi:hypothetical protein
MIEGLASLFAISINCLLQRQSPALYDATLVWHLFVRIGMRSATNLGRCFQRTGMQLCRSSTD